MKNWDARRAAKSSSANPTPSSNCQCRCGFSHRPTTASLRTKCEPSNCKYKLSNCDEHDVDGSDSVIRSQRHDERRVGRCCGGAVMSQPHTVYANGSNSGATSSGVPAGPEPVTAQGEFKQSQIVLDGSGTTRQYSAPAEVQQKPRQLRQPQRRQNHKAQTARRLATWMFLLSILALFVWWVKRRRTLRQTEQNLKPHYSL